MAVGITLDDAVPAIPVAFLGIVFTSIAKTISNPRWISHIAVGIALDDAVPAIPTAFLGIVVSFITFTISNQRRIVNMAVRITLHDAIAAIPAAFLGIVGSSCTFTICNPRGDVNPAARKGGIEAGAVAATVAVRIHLIEINAVPAIPSTFLGIVFTSIAFTISNPRWNIWMTVGIIINEAVPAIPTAFLGIVFTYYIAYTISNRRWNVNPAARKGGIKAGAVTTNVTVGILRVEINAVPAIPSAFLGIVFTCA